MKNIVKILIGSAGVLLLTSTLLIPGSIKKNTRAVSDSTEFIMAAETTEDIQISPGEDTQNPPSSEEETEVEVVPGTVKLTASSKPNGVVKLSWNKVKNASSYKLLASVNKDRGFHEIYSGDAGTRYFLHGNRKPGRKYYYRLVAFSEGKSRQSESGTIAGRALGKAELTEISNITESKNLVLKWKKVTGATGYSIKRYDKEKKVYIEIARVGSDKTTYADKNRTGGTVYDYKVCALDSAGGRGEYSNKMSQMAIDKDKKMIALTYDDGPSPNTPMVLDALEKYGAHATFFVIGYSVNTYPSSLRREIELGCEIGNHTQNHEMLHRLNSTQIKNTLEKVNQSVKKQTGVDIQLLRPPGGAYNSTVCSTANMPVIMWSVDTMDWKTRSTEETIKCVKNHASDGAVILMHDLHKPTAKAADEIVSYLKNQDYQMVTISEMAAYRGGMKDGKVYNKFKKEG